MKQNRREQTYIGFVLGMVVVLMLCFGMICVTAEPTGNTETPADASAVPERSNSPVETSPPETTDVSAETTNPPMEDTSPNTNPPTTGGVAPTPTEKPTATNKVEPTQGKTEKPVQTTPGISVTPSQGAGTATAPGVTTAVPTQPLDTTPPFTMGPISSEDLLPENNPQITPGKENGAGETPLDMHGYVLHIAAVWDEYQDPCLDLDAIEAFEKKYNCKVRFLDLSKETLYNRLLISCATGVTYFDAILVEGTDILVNLEPLGLLQSFSKYMTKEELDALPVNYQKFLSKGNTLYGIPAKAPDVAGIWYNATMVKTYQYTNPMPFYQKGSWTWYQMTSFLREATRDIDRDGYYDTYGIATSSTWYFSVLESIRGSLFRWDGERFLPGAANPVSVQALTFAQQIYTNRYIASDYERYFYSDQTPYLAGELSMYPQLKNWMKKQELVFLPYPSDSGKEPYMTVATSVPCAAITATATYPEQTAELLKILYGGDALKNRIETYCAQSGFSKQIQTAYYKMLENFTVDYTKAFDTDDTVSKQILSFLKNPKATAATVEKEIQPLVEKIIAQKNTKIDFTKVPVEIRW